MPLSGQFAHSQHTEECGQYKVGLDQMNDSHMADYGERVKGLNVESHDVISCLTIITILLTQKHVKEIRKLSVFFLLYSRKDTAYEHLATAGLDCREKHDSDDGK
jgi:hypothetical protein